MIEAKRAVALLSPNLNGPKQSVSVSIYHLFVQVSEVPLKSIMTHAVTSCYTVHKCACTIIYDELQPVAAQIRLVRQQFWSSMDSIPNLTYLEVTARFASADHQ